MKLSPGHTPARRAVEIAALALAAGVTVLLLVNGYHHVTGEPAAPRGTAQSGDDSGASNRPGGGAGPAYREAQLGRVDERNVFAPVPQPPRLTGVIGDRAIFDNDKVLKVGEEIDGAEIVSIGADSVTVERDGEERVMEMFRGPGPIQPRGPGGPMAGGPPAGSGPPGRPGTPPGAPGPPSLAPDQVDRFRAMPPEARDRVLDQMPPELAQQVRQALTPPDTR